MNLIAAKKLTTEQTERKRVLVVCEPEMLYVRYMLFKELMPNAECIERNDYCRLTTDTHRIDFCYHESTAKIGRQDQILNTDMNTPYEINFEVIMPPDKSRSGSGAYGQYRKKNEDQ